MIVDTRTLAIAAGLTARHVRRLAADGVIHPLDLHTGLPGRPPLWFDLDTSMEILDRRRAMSLTDH